MKRAQNFNRAANFFGKLQREQQQQQQQQQQQREQRPQSQQQLQESNSDMNSLFRFQSDSESLAGTSSGSSSTSQGYSHSPDDLSVDSLINILLHPYVVNGDDAIKFPQSREITSKCSDYQDFDCQMGIEGRRSSHLDLNLRSERNVFQNAQQKKLMPQSDFQQTPIVFCKIHEAHQCYCQTCSRSYCLECSIYHEEHVTINMREAMESATIEANHLLNDARIGIATMKQELNSCQSASEMIEQKARQAASDVMLCMKRISTALEIREKELLRKIEKTRSKKFSTLKARDNGLRIGIAQLTKTAYELNTALETYTVGNNPRALITCKDLALSEMCKVRQIQHNLPPPEECWISFTGSPTDALQNIVNLGTIVLNNPGHIGDRRYLKGRGNSLPQALPMTLLSSSKANVSIPRGRPIPLNEYPVTVWFGSKVPTCQPQILADNADSKDNLCRPWGVTCDKDGNVIFADRSNNRIQIYRLDGTLVRRFGTYGNGPGQFDRPAGVAVDSRRRIIIADKDNHRVQIVTMEGQYITSFGERGSLCGYFNYPWGVAVNSDCQIVISDSRNHRIQLFSPEGVFLRKFGHETDPTMWKYFDSPRGLAFNPEGNIVCADFNNHRILIIDYDFMNSRILNCEAARGAKAFLRPQGLAIDDDGNIIVADSRNHKIQVFDSVLNQDVLENLFAFICSSNNNIQRISGMVEKLCILFGKKICSVDGKDYFDFPTLELLQGDNVESILRKEGFGYRAAYIANTAKKLQELGGRKWLLSLCKCNGTLSYFEAKEQLLILPGVGPKVADCVCLMSLGYLEAIPVDTHIFQVAKDNYLPHLGKQKTVTPKINEEINKYLRELWGPLAGWAQAVLFCAKIGDNTKNILNKKRSKTESEVKTKKKIRKILTN